MNTAVIICDGEFPKQAYPQYLIRTADVIVCCDGAFGKYMRHCRKIFGQDRLPEAIVGDMDSLPAYVQRRYKSLVVPVAEQEFNDQTKAFRYTLTRWPDLTVVHFIGATGLREDHTIGNIALLMEYTRMFDLSGIYVDMVSDYSTIFALTDTAEIDVGEGRAVSIISPDNSLRIKSKGLVWPTGDVVFDNWWKATLNRAATDRISLTFSHPSLAVVILN